VVQLNDDNIAQPLRYFSLTEWLADGETLLPLTRGGQRHMLVNESWRIRPGKAQHWSKARFGEFHRLRGGDLMLVGLADENRQPIRPDRVRQLLIFYNFCRFPGRQTIAQPVPAAAATDRRRYSKRRFPAVAAQHAA
jgi:hypothetical protein